MNRRDAPKLSAEDRAFFGSFRPVAVKGAHAWVMRADGAAICSTCGLVVRARLERLGLLLTAVTDPAQLPDCTGSAAS